jgi:hypothetical protein
MLLPMWQAGLDSPLALAKSFLISQTQKGTIVPERCDEGRKEAELELNAASSREL